MSGCIHQNQIKMINSFQKYTKCRFDKLFSLYRTMCLICLLVLFGGRNLYAQERVTFEEISQIAIENNFQNSINDVQIQKAEFELKGAVDVPKTGVFIENEDFRPSDSEGVWKLGISQELPWPGLNKARKNYRKQLLGTYKLSQDAIKAEIKRDVKEAYFELWYLQDKKKLFLQLDSIYKNLFDAATIRYNVGDVAGLDKISAEVKFNEVQVLLKQLEKEMQTQQQQLMLLTNSQTVYLAEERDLIKIENPMALTDGTHPSLLVQQQNIEVSESLIEVQKKSNSPEFSARVFSQSYLGMDDPYSGFSFTVAFPLFGSKSLKNKIKALEADVELQNTTFKWQQMELDTQKEKALLQLEKEEVMLGFYESSGLQQAESIIAASSLSYRSGEISFAELSQFMAQAISIKQNYLDALNLYNQSMIDYQYLINQN